MLVVYLSPAAFILGYSYSSVYCLSVLSTWPRRCEAQRIHPVWSRISQWIPLRISLGPCLDPAAPIFGYGHLPQNLLRLYWKTVGSPCRLSRNLPVTFRKRSSAFNQEIIINSGLTGVRRFPIPHPDTNQTGRMALQKSSIPAHLRGVKSIRTGRGSRLKARFYTNFILALSPREELLSQRSVIFHGCAISALPCLNVCRSLSLPENRVGGMTALVCSLPTIDMEVQTICAT